MTKLCSGPDHFKCYDVRVQEYFLPFNVTLRDQFETKKVTAVRPTTLCNPVAKCIEYNNPSTSNVGLHSGHKPRRPPGLLRDEGPERRPQFERREVIVSNQFGKEQRLTVWRRTNLLCVPSLKAHVEPGR